MSYDSRDIFTRDQGICQICGRPIGTELWALDHFYPINKGGPDIANNVRVAHMYCNSQKGNRLPTHEEAQAWLAKIQSWSQPAAQIEVL